MSKLIYIQLSGRILLPKYRILFLVLLSVYSGLLTAKEAVVPIGNNSVYYFSTADFRILDQTDRRYSIEEVITLPDSEFNYDPENFSPRRTTHLWLRLDVFRSPEADSRWLMEVFNQRANELSVYVVDQAGQLYYTDTIGGDIPFFERKIHNRFPLFELPLQEGRNTVYLAYYSHHHLGLNTSIQSYVHYINSANKYYFIIGGFYFILLLLIFYNLLFYFSTRDRIYLYYIFFVFAAGLDCLRVDQLGFALLWPEYPSLNYFVDEYARLMLIIALVNYTTYFLNIKVVKPRLYRYICAVTGIFVLQQLFFSNFAPYAPGSLLISEVLIFSILFLILSAAVNVLQNGNRSVIIFMVGYTSITIGFVVTYLFYNGLIPGNHLVYFILFYGIAVDTLMFSFALSARLRKERRDKEKALEAENSANQKVIQEMRKNEILLNKVNAELEEKVQERTMALREANERLKEQADVISEWNRKLDRTNWELNKTIKTIETRNILSPNQTYEDMLRVFPGKSACYQYLAGVKWPLGFTCKKCGYEKATNGVSFLSQRCTRCGSVESVTAHTIFHKLKFPIEKAFYIAYIVFSDKNLNSVSELAREIDLNYKTCLKFSQKVGEAIEHRKKRGIKLKSWEDIVLDS